METHYYIPTFEEAHEFDTWTYDEHEIADTITKFYKLDVPDYLSVPSENPDVIKQQHEWFDKSNREDKIILEREKECFDAYYNSTMHDIEKYLK